MFSKWPPSDKFQSSPDVPLVRASISAASAACTGSAASKAIQGDHCFFQNFHGRSSGGVPEFHQYPRRILNIPASIAIGTEVFAPAAVENAAPDTLIHRPSDSGSGVCPPSSAFLKTRNAPAPSG